MNIVATNHALDRWRERVAIYGDETIIDMRARLNEAIALQGEIPQGISTYKIGSVVFILDVHNTLCQIVTVIDESVKIPIKDEDRSYCKEKAVSPPKPPKKIYQAELTIPVFPTKSDARSWLMLQLEVCEEKIGIQKANKTLIEQSLRKCNENTIDTWESPCYNESVRHN